MIIGCGGSGKSTLAVHLHYILDYPVLFLDKYYFGPNWKIPSVEEWENTVTNLIAGDRWIMDGNYGGTMELRFARADTVIFMDLPTPLKLWRVFWRTLRSHGKSRPDMAEGCVDRFEWQFFKYIYAYNKTRRPKILKRLEELSETKNIFILRSKKEVKHFLKEVKSNQAIA